MLHVAPMVGLQPCLFSNFVIYCQGPDLAPYESGVSASSVPVTHQAAQMHRAGSHPPADQSSKVRHKYLFTVLIVSCFCCKHLCTASTNG